MKIKLSEVSTRAPKDTDKEEGKAKLTEVIEELDELQNLLFAEGKNAVLVVIQGMDASGKDGAIRNVFGALNPQGVSVTSFKVPTAEETAHDFLWRIHEHTPAKGMIKVFNRSHYENVLVTRVHKDIDDEVAHKRMEAMNDFEKLLAKHNNTLILKFFLHVSRKEQTERLNERLTDVRKHWKANPNDFKEAEHWDEYMQYYEEIFEKCDYTPWTIVPADQNWYKELLIAKTLRDELKKLKMEYPGVDKG
ncbi:MAG TPA: PPK2 family polyphosphate kinase [Segetibacter sp.]